MFRRCIVGNAASPHYGLKTISKIMTSSMISSSICYKPSLPFIFYELLQNQNRFSREVGYVMM